MKTTLLLLMILLMLSGCVTYNVRVDSYGIEDVSTPKNYVFIPSDSNIHMCSLEYQEYTGYLKKVLYSKGYNFVEDVSNADVIIFINYGISDPISYERLVSKPVWGKTGVSSSTTIGSVYTNPYTNTYSQTTINNPQYGVTGYRYSTKTETSYYRFLQLVAFDDEYFRIHNEPKMLWQTDAVSTGYSDDLRVIFPILVAASKDYFGKNSGQKIDIYLNKNDKRIKEVKGID